MKSRKPWHKMSAEELARQTKEYDSGSPPRGLKPSAAELALHRRAMQKPKGGRPPLGDGAVSVLFTIHPDLLVRLDNFARGLGIKRSRLISISVDAYMNAHAMRKSSPKPAA